MTADKRKAFDDSCKMLEGGYSKGPYRVIVARMMVWRGRKKSNTFANGEVYKGERGSEVVCVRTSTTTLPRCAPRATAYVAFSI